MYVRVFVCVYVYMYVVCIYVCVCACVYVCERVWGFVRVRVLAQVYDYVSARSFVRMCARVARPDCVHALAGARLRRCVASPSRLLPSAPP